MLNEPLLCGHSYFLWFYFAVLLLIKNSNLTGEYFNENENLSFLKQNTELSLQTVIISALIDAFLTLLINIFIAPNCARLCFYH